ncbi:sodium-coupled monocarboxylate transporter 2 [Galendromus occidentalis]|uniref:Sodium-coupled monocarboxylate transporter 2 n=1 Tax=Galendromus occidentalis TaxID=34638 RepID=A0AAJ6QWQ6_9ACAR|nr:sodium-coupled monocarboxylate transporter 2 [Galendromus occidentalis]
MASFHALDYAVLVLSLMLSSFIGMFFAWKDRRKQNNAEFLLGSRQMGVVPVSLSLMASFMSAITVLAYPAEVYSRGAAISVSVMSSMFATICAGELMVPVFYRLRLTSMNDYLERRFQSKALRKGASAASLFSVLIFLGVQLYAPAVAVEAVTGLAVPVSMLAVGTICTFYTTIGGMKAVVWTDVVQMSLMFFGLVMVFAKAVYDVGGLPEVFRRANEAGRLNVFRMMINPYAADSFWNCFVGMGVLWFSANGMNQMQIQRYCSLPTAAKARVAVYLNMLGVASTITMAFGAGLSVYAYYHGCDPIGRGFIKSADQLMPYFVLERLNLPGIPGLFVSAVFAGSLSSLSSGFNSMSACIYEDFLAPYLPKNFADNRATLVTRLIALTIGVITIGFGFLSAYVGNILHAALGISAAIIGPTCGVFLCGVTLPFVNTPGAIAGFTVSLTICAWSAVGKLLYPAVMTQLPLVVQFCNASLPDLAVSTVDYRTTVFYAKPVLRTIQPSGILQLYQIHPYVIPAMSLAICVSVAVLVSIFTGGNRTTKIDPELFNYTCYEKFSWNPPKALDVLSWFDLGSDDDAKESRVEDIPLKTQIRS